MHLISLGKDEEAQKIYDDLTAQNIEVLFDDRDARAGEKFADSDLIGIPYRIVVSDRSIQAGGVEFKKRNESESEIVKVEEILGKVN
ncbi:MAG: Proline-tRNA ligase [Candidatus Moranbacteria bacterium GW2011_GWF2_35_54]|nr:MAG: Proline-tRNA ligase [Candidatus Moranbacteria bacterium GW2011_GWF2_35_54]